jgi:two-component system NtrC family sensor kinase
MGTHKQFYKLIKPAKPNRNQAALRLISETARANFGSIEAREWLVNKLGRVLDSETSLLLLRNGERLEASLRDQRQKNPAHIYQIQLDMENGVIENCMQGRKTACFQEDSLDRSLTCNLIDGPIHSVLCAPLLAGEQVLGALAVVNRLRGQYSEQDNELLARIADSVAQSIYNARLIQELKVANADLEVSHWQLLRSRNTLRTLFDSIPTSIYIIDQKYNLAAINMHRADRIQTAPNHLVGRRCYEALYQREEVCPDCHVIETIYNGISTNRTKRLWHNDLDSQEWEISTYPIFDDANQVSQAILLEQDVTEKNRLEATLAQSEKLAAVGQLAAGLAHEINNPLTAIIANAQLLQREIPAEDDKQELIDLIARAGQRASQVVRNLLDLARKEQYDFAPTDVNDTIRKSLTFLQHEFMTHSAKLIFEPAENLPKIKASQDHLQGVWLNLLTNALDSLDNGPNEIRVTTRVQNNEVRVVVSDTGKGIPPERLSRIFEPFYTTKAPGRGTGLGLSVCHRVIKQHGGRMMVDSKLEAGTQFTVILPVG